MSVLLLPEQYQLHPGNEVLDLSEYVEHGVITIGHEDGFVNFDDRSFDRLVALVTAKRKERENLRGHARYGDLERRADALRLRLAAHGWRFVEGQGIAPEALSSPERDYIEIEIPDGDCDETRILDHIERLADRLDEAQKVIQ